MLSVFFGNLMFAIIARLFRGKLLYASSELILYCQLQKDAPSIKQNFKILHVPKK